MCQRQPRRASRERVQVSRSTRTATVVPRRPRRRAWATPGRPAAADQASAQRLLGPPCPARKLRTPAVEVSVAWSPSMAPASPCSEVDVVSFAVRGWTVNEIPSTPVPLPTVGLDLCGLDRPRGDAALPSSPSAEPRTRKGKSSGPCRPRRASHHGGVGQRAALRRPPASARRGARIAGGAGLAAHFTSRPVLQSLPPDARGRAYVSLILAANVGCF